MIVFLIGMAVAVIAPMVERGCAVLLIGALPVLIVLAAGTLLGAWTIGPLLAVGVPWLLLGYLRLRLMASGYGPDVGPVQRVHGGPR